MGSSDDQARSWSRHWLGFADSATSQTATCTDQDRQCGKAPDGAKEGEISVQTDLPNLHHDRIETAVFLRDPVVRSLANIREDQFRQADEGPP